MKNLTQALRCTVLTTVVVVLCGCANMSAKDQNTTVGAGIGAVAGAVLTGGSPVGTVGGAVVGGVIGNQVKR
jgi:osmotically inducible lipoprotein OsmB